MITLNDVRSVWDTVADRVNPGLTWQLNACRAEEVEPPVQPSAPSIVGFAPLRGYEVIVTQFESLPMLRALDMMFSDALEELVEMIYEHPVSGRTARWIIQGIHDRQEEAWWQEIVSSVDRRVSYKEHLVSPEWRKRREAMLWLAGNRCQVCNATEGPLDVHHRTYERLGNEQPEDLLVLCRKCHGLFHDNGRLTK